MKTETGICYNCGADEGLHQYETMLCPRHGIEETGFDKLKGKFYSQEWESTTFKDSGLKKLSNAAPELLEALIKIVHTDDELCKCPACKIGKPIIKKATQ